jgi:hypothetical protein
MRPRPPTPDIIVDRPAGLLLVDVKRSINERDLEYFVDQLDQYVDATHRQKPAFSLLVDLAKMRFYRGTDSSAPLATLHTPEILSRYDAKFGHDPIYEDYLAALVQSWLNDLALTAVEEFPREAQTLPQDLKELLAA